MSACTQDMLILGLLLQELMYKASCRRERSSCWGSFQRRMWVRTQDFGAYGDDPLKRGIGGAKEMTGAATTRDLAAGTARSTLQVPGMIVSHLDMCCIGCSHV